MTCGLVRASYSLPEWQAVKLTFFTPWQLHSISDQLSEFTLLLILVGKQNLSAICAI